MSSWSHWMFGLLWRCINKQAMFLNRLFRSSTELYGSRLDKFMYLFWFCCVMFAQWFGLIDKTSDNFLFNFEELI